MRTDILKPSLDTCLNGLHCHGCGRHCPLSNPSCGKGDRQAQREIENYKLLHGIEE